MKINRFDGTEYACFSNFYPAEVEYEEIIYPTNEHAFQAAKSHDKNFRLEVSRASTSAFAKRMGRVLTSLRKDWEDVKYGIMKELIRTKFTKHLDLRSKLLDTGNAELIEGNTWGDVVWGVCNGVGTNWLGKILMEVREELK